MSKSLFEEAIADAKMLREAAEQNAKNAIIEAVTPRIREFIEKQLVGGNADDESGDFLNEALSVDEGEKGDDDEEVTLDESALSSLVNLMSGANKGSENPDLSAIDHAVGSLSEADRSALLKLLNDPNQLAERAMSGADDAYEIDLDDLRDTVISEMKPKNAKIGEKSMRNKEKVEENDLYELDEMMYDDEDEDYLDEDVRLLFSKEDRDALGDEAFEKLMGMNIQIDSSDEGGEEEPAEVEVGEEESAEDAAAAAAGEEGGEGGEMSEAIYEIDENMLRRELARLREAKAKKSGKSATSHQHAAKAFGGGTLEGDVLEVDLNKGDVHKKLVKEARENRALKQQLNDYRGAVETLREQLSDLNLFNAKLLYVNKILQNKDVAPNQRRAIIEALDGASNLREAKLLYESLSTSITKKNESLNESVRHTAGLASRPTTSASARMSGAGEVDRWAILAGIK